MQGLLNNLTDGVAQVNPAEAIPWPCAVVFPASRYCFPARPSPALGHRHPASCPGLDGGRLVGGLDLVSVGGQEMTSGFRLSGPVSRRRPSGWTQASGVDPALLRGRGTSTFRRPPAGDVPDRSAEQIALAILHPYIAQEPRRSLRLDHFADGIDIPHALERHYRLCPNYQPRVDGPGFRPALSFLRLGY